ncbi:MAG: hypothetical protein HYZ16_08225 [Bacteroidetes bacterium]|nr:hypothetical protein [Bacteroidota bacterium]
MTLSGCVSKKKYLALEDAKKKTELRLSESNKENKSLTDELVKKTKEASKLYSDLDALKEEFNDIKNEMLESNARKNTLIEELNRKLALLSTDNKAAKDSLQQVLIRLDKKEQRYGARQKELREKLAGLDGIEKALALHASQVAEMDNFLTHNFDKNNIANAFTSVEGGFLYLTFSPGVLFEGNQLTAEGKRMMKIVAAMLANTPDVFCTIASNWNETSLKELDALGQTQEKSKQVTPLLLENVNTNPRIQVSSERIGAQQLGSGDHEIALVFSPSLANLTGFAE